MPGAGLFQPHRSPDQDARVRHIEQALARLSAVVVNGVQTPALAAKNAGNAIVVQGGASSSGTAPGVLSGDVTGPAAANTVALLQGNLLTISSPPTLGDLLEWDGTHFLNTRTLNGSLTAAEGVNLSTGTVTGTTIGTATTQKLSFWNAAPIVQPGNTTDLRLVLINTGLLASGGASPLNLNGGVLTASGTGNSLGATTLTGDLTLSTHNLITDTVTGTKIGTGTNQLLGFFNAVPVAQQGSTADLRTGLINLGFFASGGATPLNLNGGVLTASGSGNSLGSTTLTGDLTLSTHNLVTDTATGTKIGTAGGAAGQKLGFFNAAPIVQPLLATGAAHTVDDVISTLQSLGLCRQV